MFTYFGCFRQYMHRYCLDVTPKYVCNATEPKMCAHLCKESFIAVNSGAQILRVYYVCGYNKASIQIHMMFAVLSVCIRLPLVCRSQSVAACTSTVAASTCLPIH